MAGSADSARISARLNELYERHRSQDETRLPSYYASGRGYYPPAEAGDERDLFAVCLATVGGELYTAGDHDVPFALQSISKVFAYALALADHRLEDVLARGASELHAGAPAGERRPFAPADEPPGRQREAQR